ncbi:MAG: polysaccharide biosynthesis/export family protein [Opitutaceae bacterium]|nr:polysaccharide biosynthesis/export family protein [Opitutaceae bacterium]
MQILNAGDVIKVSFPGSATLDMTQQIRRDGMVNLYLVGEVKAVDKTPAQLEKELVALYASQITSKEVKVTVVSSAFSVFVTGAVIKPGKVTSERELTAFDAIMEAGGFDESRANKKRVRIVRQDGGKIENFEIDFKKVLEGRGGEPFYLKAHDTVYVPERISWF